MLVTGASGFIGKTLCARLAAEGHETIAVDARLVHYRHHPLDPADILVHLAGVAHRKAASADLKAANVTTSEKVGQAAAAAGIRMLYVSSVKVHGDESCGRIRESSPLEPVDEYGASKAEAEGRLRDLPGLQLTILRPPLVYGPGVKANFLLLLKAIANRWPLPFASIDNRRSFIYVGNLADAIIRCGKSPAATGKTYLLADGRPVSTPDLCLALGAALGVKPRLFPCAPRLLELMPGMKKLTRSLQVDDSAIRTELAWRPPFTFDEGLHAAARWYQGR